MTTTPAYSAEALRDETGALADIRLTVAGRTRHMAGRTGPEGELRLVERLADTPEDALVVLVGSGLGVALEALARQGRRVLVVDRETPILELTGARERMAAYANVVFALGEDVEAVMQGVAKARTDLAGAPLAVLINPVYPRLDKDFYGAVAAELKALEGLAGRDFWARARYPKFKAWPPRILLMTSRYFLMGEIVTACQRLDVPHRLIHLTDDEMGSNAFVEELLTAIAEFKPDFVFTINHLGVDREGVLMDLLARLELPLASWFVDNPHLILYLYDRLVAPHAAIFTWDADNLASLKAMGFEHVHYLPLGVDARRFHPDKAMGRDHHLRADLSFVGNSMLYKVGHRMKAGRFPKELLLGYKEVARAFGAHEEQSVRAFLAAHLPDLSPHFEALGDLEGVAGATERKLSYETMITWEATRQYRRACVAATLPFGPLIAGDPGWKITFAKEPGWRWHPEVNYYDELPQFYSLATVNFNCTSKQMKGAVNQRVFDVPATGNFVVSDYRRQIEDLFEPGTEAVLYHEPEEATDLVARYLKDHQGRRAVAAAARRRVLAQHTYERRLTRLMERMRDTFGAS